MFEQKMHSIHFQWSKYTVVDEESDSQVKSKKIQRPGAKN